MTNDSMSPHLDGSELSADHRQGAHTLGVALYTGQRIGAAEGPGWYTDAVPLAVAAEQAGFDTIWVSEHHALGDGYVPAPLTVLAAMAAATRRIVLATGVLLGPLYHPIRLAEETAVVDQLSAGRLLLGLGLGYSDDDERSYPSPGVGRARRLEEVIQILRLAWTGERFSFSGASIDVDDARVTPVPYGGRQIPIVLGGYASPAIRRAARLADGHLVGRGAPEIIAAAISEIEAVGGPARAPFTLGVNLALVLDEPGGSVEAALRGFAAQQQVYESLQYGRDVFGGKVAEVPRGEGLALGSIDQYLQQRGSADELAATICSTIERIPSWASVHIALRIVFPEPDLDRQLERLSVFGERVLPLVRSAMGA